MRITYLIAPFPADHSFGRSVPCSLKYDRIESLVHWHNHLKSQLNLTALAESGKPAGVGTKHKWNGVSKQTSRQVHILLSDAAESDYTYRVHCEGMGQGMTSPPSTSPSLSDTGFHPSVQVQQSFVSVTCPSLVPVVRSPTRLVHCTSAIPQPTI